ncbi:lysophospholipid acyltransferase family protein [Psychrobacter sp.]|uniref:lysophospholipid acyltransferase family protein n=1 Tax=Psychrobacter sp. TaxID=56811 RepID=UPI0025D34E73|nr:lysophospholipid acyltransferase family protein [Psychrobacter sp.]
MSNEKDLDKSKVSTKQLLSHKLLGEMVPKRGGALASRIGQLLIKAMGWKLVGSIPNVPKAVMLAMPHTSNFDGLYSIPAILALDLDVKLLGKDSLFKYPILSDFFKWAGVIPINRSKKGTVLQASIDQMKRSQSLFLGLAPEGTRGYSEQLKTGFYYIAKESGVPIIPVAMDYKTKEIRFLEPIYTTGDIDADMQKILIQYKEVVPKHPEKMAKALQDINN